MKKTCLLLLVLLATPAFGAIRYVDSNSPGGNDGATWATAWDHPTQISAGAGDTVYISGGTTSKTYTFTSSWDVPNGASGNPLTISRSSDAGHNGEVIFLSSGAAAHLGGLMWVTFDFSTNHNALPANSTPKLRFSGATGGGNNIVHDDNTSRGLKIFGAYFNWRVRIVGAQDVEIANCQFNSEARKLTGGPGWLQGVGTSIGYAYGGNLIHHNRFDVFHRYGVDANGDNGDDCIQNISGTDVYNNEFISTFTAETFAGGNHQDLIQTGYSHNRFWNNYFENSGQYCIFAEIYGNSAGWYIYNNVFNYSEPTLDSGSGTSAIAFGSRYTGTTVSEVVIANNTINGGAGVAIGNASFQPPPESIVGLVQNNLFYSSGGLRVTVGPAGSVTNSNNVQPTGASPFVDAAGRDFRLAPTSTGAINAGVSLSAYFTTDKAGVTRPQGSAWDIGAYEFVSSVGPGSVSFATAPMTVNEGAGTLAVTINRVNGTTGAIGVSYATSNGTATSGSDYTGTSGTLSWADGDGAAKSFNVAIAQDAAVEGNEDFTVTLSSATGGAAIVGVTSTTATIIDDEAPVIPLMSGLTFTAELGLVEAPFAATGTAVSQTVDTGPTDGGRARYRVTIPTTGDYSMTMNMNCASTGADSIYVSWDGEPSEPVNVFDVGVTTGFQTKAVTWRGTGTPAAPEFNPKFWNLTAGVHELTIRGREPGAQFNSITVIASAPTDVTAPTPDPPTWEFDPIALVGPEGQTRLTMTVAPVTDPSVPIEYYFDETSGGPGATDSGWQTGTIYLDDGLTPNTTYTYRVKARDSEGNETSLSAVGSGTTNAVVSGSTTINATNLIISP